jgi:predicted MFS family arabinose efflux permease
MTGSSTKQAGAPRWSALQRWTLGVTSMAAFMAGMDALVVTTALPTIHADLGAATSALSWTVAAYALGFAAVVLAGVALGDRYGRRPVFLTGLALFTLGSVPFRDGPGLHGGRCGPRDGSVCPTFTPRKKG